MGLCPRILHVSFSCFSQITRSIRLQVDWEIRAGRLEVHVRNLRRIMVVYGVMVVG